MEALDEPPSTLFLTVFQWLGTVTTSLEPFDPTLAMLEIVAILIALVFSALYSGSEVAFFSVAKQMHLLEPDQKRGGVDGKSLAMLSKPRKLLATILVGNTVANVVASVLAASFTGRLIAQTGASQVVVYTIEVIVLSFMILILSEIAPKIIAINNPLKTSRKLAPFIYFHFVLLSPITRLFSEGALALERVIPKPSTKVTSEDLKAMAEASEKEGSIKEDEREIIENVIEFGSITVREIMTSRMDVVAVSVDQSLKEVLELIRENGFSRMPLYENDLDTILGIIYTKDVLPFIQSDPDTTEVNWRTIARKALFIPSTKKLDALLQDFRNERTHMAVVVDEYGGTDGVVTMDDVLEEIVGDLSDEQDEEEEKLYSELKSGVYLFDSRIDLDEVGELFDMGLTSDEDDFETLGGLVYYLTERIPSVGEKVQYKGLELSVHSIRNGRISKIRAKKN